MRSSKNILLVTGAMVAIVHTVALLRHYIGASTYGSEANYIL